MIFSSEDTTSLSIIGSQLLRVFPLPVVKSQTLSDLSKEAEIACLQSGVTVTAVMSSVCPMRVRINSPVTKLHTFKVLSREPDKTSCLSGLTATAST